MPFCSFELEVLGDIAADQTNEADIYQLGGVDIRIGIDIYVDIREEKEVEELK